MDAVKALTIWPEWAFAICHLEKRIENRSWRPPASLVGKRMAIHAGAHLGGRKGRVAAVQGLEAVRYTLRNLPPPLDHLGPLDSYTLSGFPYQTPQWIRVTDRAGQGGEESRVTERIDIVTGAVVATAVVAGLVDDRPALRKNRGELLGRSIPPWAVPDQVWWMLTDVEVLAEPVPCKGSQGLWDWER